MDINSIRQRLGDQIAEMPLIDTHEHLPAAEAKRDPKGDLFTEFLSHYFNRDLLSAGLPPRDLDRVLNKEGTVADRWSLLEPYWKPLATPGMVDLCKLPLPIFTMCLSSTEIR